MLVRSGRAVGAALHGWGAGGAAAVPISDSLFVSVACIRTFFETRQWRQKAGKMLDGCAI